LDSLLRPLNPRLSEATWRRLFEPQWGVTDRSVGMQLMDDARPVGFASFIHAQLPLADGSFAPLCNISTWVTEPAFGAQAMALVMPVLALRDVTITNLTPIPAVHGIFSKLGFRTLEDHLVYLRPSPFAHDPWGPTEVSRGLDGVEPRLPAWERAIARAHGSQVEHLCLSDRTGRHCYVMYQIVRRRRLRTARVLWVTPGTMPAVSIALRRALLRASGALLVELEGRHAGGRPPASFVQQLAVPRLYRSPRLEPADVPSAYSELVVLGV
jgi:hypothetical protein